MATEAGNTSQAYDTTRREFLRVYRSRFGESLDRLTWPRERRTALRDQRLRELLHTARTSSPWHAKRLRDIDPAEATVDDLKRIPPMSKTDLMSNWDDIVTDRRVTLEKARSHLRSVAERGHDFFLDRYNVVESGGTSGSQGVFVWDFGGWIEGRLGDTAGVAWLTRHMTGQADWVDGHRWAYIGSSSDTHMARAERVTFRESEAVLLLGANMPMNEIVGRLNDFHPAYIFVYPSILQCLSSAALSGDLRIAPRLICTGSETLRPKAKQEAEEVFGVPVLNNYASSECGTIAHGSPNSSGLHLLEENAVHEPVDRDGRAVSPGVKSAKLLVTNVINKVLPLIRYEVEDDIEVLAADQESPWTGRQVHPPMRDGISVFRYPEAGSVHPHAFRTILGRLHQVRQYQVRQTPNGADIALQCDAPVDIQAVTSATVQMLCGVGLRNPEVSVTAGGDILRSGVGEKFKHFIPLRAR